MLASFSCFSQQKQDYNVLTPASVSFVKKTKFNESNLAFGIKTFLSLNSFGNYNGQAGNLNPGFGAGVVCQLKPSNHFSLRNELLFTSIKFSQKNVNYSVSYPWLLNYHFKNHAYLSFGVLPSLLFVDRSVFEKASNVKGYTAIFELAGSFGVEYPIDQNLDFGLRIVTSFNKLFKTNLEDHQGVSVNFTYYWARYSLSKNKLMVKRKKKVKTDTSRYY